MIRSFFQALVIVMALLILMAEVQRRDDAPAAQISIVHD